MKQRIFSVLLIATLGIALTGAATAQDSMTKLASLDAHLRAIESEAKTDRYIASGVLIGLGAGVGGGLYLYGEQLKQNPSQEYNAQPLQISGAVVGICLVVPGAIIFALPTENETLPRNYFSLPQGSETERAARIATGETYLSSLADKARTMRYTNTLFSAGFAAYSFASLGALDIFVPGLSASIAPYYGNTPELRQTALYQGITFLASAAASALFPSRAERERDAYFSGSAALPEEGPRLALGPGSLLLTFRM